MEELGNLATGFEVDGGHLRHQLYVWLEKETEVMKAICGYGMGSQGHTGEGRMPIENQGHTGEGRMPTEYQGLIEVISG